MGHGSPASSTAAPACRWGRCWPARSAGWSIGYLGSLAVCSSSPSGRSTPLSGEVVHGLSFENFETLFDEPVYRDIVGRTVLIAALVTVTDAVLAFPIAFYMAKVASRRGKAILVVAVLLPLWSSYLVKVYAWRDDALRRRRDQLGAGAARPATGPATASPRSGW